MFRLSSKYNQLQWLLSIFIVSMAVTVIAGDIVPLILKQTFSKSDIQKIQIADMDYDSIDEYIIEVPQEGVTCALRIYSGDFQRLFFQKNFHSRILAFDAVPWAKTGVKELLVIEHRERQINLLILDGRTGQDTLTFMNLYTTKSENADINIAHLLFSDLNMDGLPEVYIPFSAGLGAELRSVWAVDIEARKVLWNYDLGPNVHRLELLEAETKADPLLLVSNQGPGNGHRTGETNDAASYFMVLNARNGRVINAKKQGGWPSLTDISTLQHEGKDYIYSITLIQTAQKTDTGELLVWDDQAKNVLKRIPNIYMDEYLLAADINNDGNDELIRSGHDNQIVVYDLELNRLDTFQMPGSKARIHYIHDMNHDGFLELLVAEDRTGIVLADHRGQTIGRRDMSIGKLFQVNKGMDADLNVGVFYYSERTYREWSILPNQALVGKEGNSIIRGILIGILFSGLIVATVLIYRRLRPGLFTNPAVFDSLNIPILIVELSGRVRYVNRQMENLLELDAGTIKAGTVDDILGRLGLDFSINDWKQCSEPLEFEVKPKTRTGKSRYVIRIRSLTQNGRVMALILIAEDMSRTANYKRSLAWTGMAQRLVHEIKNPLTTVKLTLQRLKMEYEEDPPEKQQHYNTYIDSVLEEVIRLRNVAENFLKFFKAEHPAFKSVDLAEVIGHLVKKYAGIIPENITIRFNNKADSCIVDADPTQVEIMISNVLDNSIHAITKKGYIEITLTGIEKIEHDAARQYVVIDIEDNGCGIGESALKKVFEPYISGDSDGTGLGLSIVKKMVESHNGSVTITSKKNMGTLVSLTLPFKQKAVLE